LGKIEFPPALALVVFEFDSQPFRGPYAIDIGCFGPFAARFDRGEPGSCRIPFGLALRLRGIRDFVSYA